MQLTPEKDGIYMDNWWEGNHFYLTENDFKELLKFVKKEKPEWLGSVK